MARPGTTVCCLCTLSRARALRLLPTGYRAPSSWKELFDKTNKHGFLARLGPLSESPSGASLLLASGTALLRISFYHWTPQIETILISLSVLPPSGGGKKAHPGMCLRHYA
uniref:Uncharacterized protein n=1 Tax=Suricata suricatta TaxID=37032 RepID=A0A673SSE1_SURSU